MKKKTLLLILFIILFQMAKSQTTIDITVDGRTMSATLADNAATKALIEKLSEGPVAITMNNYGGFEKVGALPWTLPSADTRITTTPGDIMLYTANNVVIFYGTNTWSYTPLGRLETDSASEISEFVGNGTRQVTFSLAASAGIEKISREDASSMQVCSLDGKPVVSRPLKPGLYIAGNRKIIIK